MNVHDMTVCMLIIDWSPLSVIEYSTENGKSVELGTVLTDCQIGYDWKSYDVGSSEI